MTSAPNSDFSLGVSVSVSVRTKTFFDLTH